jgi:hypothetical protein
VCCVIFKIEVGKPHWQKERLGLCWFMPAAAVHKNAFGKFCRLMLLPE